MRHTILLIAQVFAVSTVLVACDRVEDADTKDEESSTEASGGGSVAGAGAGVGGGATASVATRITVPAGITDDYVNVKAVAPNAAPQAPNGEKVLIIVANDGFYFKEYSDPRVELEAAGYTVVVAAATTPTALPHPNSGQLSGDGRTTVDLALADVVATDYVALVVAGG